MQIISSDKAPKAIGPYSQAIAHGGLVWCSGQIALDPATGGMVGAGDVRAEATQALKNLAAVLNEAGTGFDRVVKVTIFLMDMADFAVVNEVYAAAIGDARPARATVQVAGLPKGARVEIDCVAAV
ncbi:MAG: RidA family protein [Deltaproteobacteria bacterium]|nr:RidA family protein [Deltaproteobacteria bacterium]MBK9646416.1 RidA family protein [Deltaproteobacteria bacterium]